MLTEKVGRGIRQLAEIRLQLQPPAPSHRLHNELLREADSANACAAPLKAAVRLLDEAEACACMWDDGSQPLVGPSAKEGKSWDENTTAYHLRCRKV